MVSDAPDGSSPGRPGRPPIEGCPADPLLRALWGQWKTHVLYLAGRGRARCASASSSAGWPASRPRCSPSACASSSVRRADLARPRAHDPAQGHLRAHADGPRGPRRAQGPRRARPALDRSAEPGAAAGSSGLSRPGHRPRPAPRAGLRGAPARIRAPRGPRLPRPPRPRRWSGGTPSARPRGRGRPAPPRRAAGTRPGPRPSAPPRAPRGARRSPPAWARRRSRTSPRRPRCRRARSPPRRPRGCRPRASPRRAGPGSRPDGAAPRAPRSASRRGRTSPRRGAPG